MKSDIREQLEYLGFWECYFWQFTSITSKKVGYFQQATFKLLRTFGLRLQNSIPPINFLDKLLIRRYHDSEPGYTNQRF